MQQVFCSEVSVFTAPAVLIKGRLIGKGNEMSRQQDGKANKRTFTEVGNVTSKCNGVTRHHFCLAVKAINFRSDNGLNVNIAITMSSDNCFFKPRAITFRSNNFSPQHIALCKIA